MSLTLRNLSVLAYANGFTLWHYQARQDEDTTASSFLAGAVDLLHAGDLIISTTATGGKLGVVIGAAPDFRLQAIG